MSTPTGWRTPRSGLRPSAHQSRPTGSTSSAGSAHRHAEEVNDHFGVVNQIYNNAGIAFYGDVEISQFSEIERVMDVDFWGVVNGTKAFLPHLIASGHGHVINVSSAFGLFAAPGEAAYNSAKFAVRGFSEALYQELALASSPAQSHHRVPRRRPNCVHQQHDDCREPR